MGNASTLARIHKTEHVKVTVNLQLLLMNENLGQSFNTCTGQILTSSLVDK